MTEPAPAFPDVELLEVPRLHLVPGTVPPVSPEQRAAQDREWAKALRANPHLFDGPVVVCAGLRREGPDDLVLTWAATTYRHRALRRVAGGTSWLPSLYVAVVLPVEDGRLLVGRMAPETAAPGQWQLPGGSVEPPDGREPLDEAALRGHAARELAEEVGVEIPPGELSRWLVTRGRKGSVGVLFLAPALPAELLEERFAALTAAEIARGVVPELDRIALVDPASGSSALAGRSVDYLEPVLGRYAERGHPPRP